MLRQEAAELVGDSDGCNNMSMLAARKLPTLPSKLLQETRREALLDAVGGGEGTSSAIRAGGSC